jgi:CspA family cold shock protein
LRVSTAKLSAQLLPQLRSVGNLPATPPSIKARPLFDEHPTTLSEETIMAIGTVKFFNSEEGFGFIKPKDGSKDVYVHISSVAKSGLATLDSGQKVSYEIMSKNGKSTAIDLKLV